MMTLLNINKKNANIIYLLIVILMIISPLSAFAENGDTTNPLKHYIGDIVNTGKDTGYSKTHALEQTDPHYGWKIGHFYIKGYTSLVTDKDNNPIFLKNVGDKVALYFNLEQDINKLNGKEELTISSDDNGYDKGFEVKKQNFGRGTLILRHTNHENLPQEPKIYTNYLEAKTKKGADTKVELFEEGDYEVALDYEIKNDPRKVFGLSVFPSYTNYRIYFKFSVRNGNCMAYTFDAASGEELSNKSFTKNGFRIDLAKSHYLDTNIRKEILKEGTDGLTEDTRFNRPTKDGDVYIEEGIYTITVYNRYTEQETEKKIYVGENDILKAHLATGLSIKEIEEKLSNGATVNSDGAIVLSTGTIIKENETNKDGQVVYVNNDLFSDVSENAETKKGFALDNKYILFLSITILAIMGIIIYIIYKKKHHNKTEMELTSENEIVDEEEEHI